MKRHKGGMKGLRPLKERRTKRQLAKAAAKQQQRKESKKVVPNDGS